MPERFFGYDRPDQKLSVIVTFYYAIPLLLLANVLSILLNSENLSQLLLGHYGYAVNRTEGDSAIGRDCCKP
jgi:hypothetical protein